MDKKESILETLALQNKASVVKEGKLIKGTSYKVDNQWYEVIWSGEKYAYCKTFNEITGEEKVLMRVDKLEKGDCCPF